MASITFPKLGVKTKKLALKVLAVLLLSTGLFVAGYFFHQAQAGPSSISDAGRQNKSYYISFDDYYYEVPKQKTVDDKILVGGQFLYSFNVAVKTNSLDDIFNDGAIAVQALIPLGGDNEAFERYLNTSIKPSAESAFGSAELSFSERSDKLKTAELVSKKDDKVVRRQYLINLPQAVAVITKDDSEAFRSVAKSVGQASSKFADYNDIKLLVLSQSFMLRNRMFEDMYRQANTDLKDSTSVDELNRIADRSKEIFGYDAQVTGVKLSDDEMTSTVHFVDSGQPANNKTATLTFKQTDGKWQLFGLKLPNGVVTGASPEDAKQDSSSPQ